jgi:hypothetical protein
MTFELHYASITSCLARPEVNDWINKNHLPGGTKRYGSLRTFPTATMPNIIHPWIISNT